MVDSLIWLWRMSCVCQVLPWVGMTSSFFLSSAIVSPHSWCCLSFLHHCWDHKQVFYQHQQFPASGCFCLSTDTRRSDPDRLACDSVINITLITKDRETTQVIYLLLSLSQTQSWINSPASKSAVFGSNEKVPMLTADADCTCVRYILINAPIVENLVRKNIPVSPSLCSNYWLAGQVNLSFPF